MTAPITLVTGGTGCVGSQLVKSLLNDGRRVRVLTRSLARGRTRVPEGAEVVEGDVSRPEDARRAVAGCECVYHLAGPFREAGLPDERYREVQVEGTRNMLEASLQEGVKNFVHVSTIGVLGHVEHPPADETSPYNPGDVYQETKMEGEQLALEFRRQHGEMHVTVARPASVYGPGDLRFLKLFKAIRRGWFVMLGRGDVLLHLVYLEDVVRGLRMLEGAPQADGEVFILAGPQARPLNDITAMIADILQVKRPRRHAPAWPVQLAGSICERICIPLGINPPIFRRRVDFFTKSRAFRIDKAERLVGFRPQVDVLTGLQRTADWYRGQRLLD